MALNDSWNGSFVLFDYASYVYDNGAMKAKSKTFSIISISTTFGGLFGIGFIIIIIARSPIDFTIKGLRRRRHLKSMLPDALKATAYSYRFNSPAQPAYVKLLGDTRSHYVYGVLSDWAHTSLPKKGVAGAGVYWLQGSGSSWRSAVAQRLAKECEGKKLLATFFFSNEDPRRNTPQYLALAIAHEMLNTGSFGTRNSVIQALSKQWGMLLTAPVEMQFERLVINAYLNWRNKLYNALRFPFRTMTASSTLIILDGLDECSSVKEQEQVLSLVLIAMEKKLPIRFLISSRPTQHLRRQFDKPELRQHTKIISLDSDSDTPLATRETKRGTLRDYHNATILFSPPYGSGPSMA
ncbi:hypothetical protein L218DRAFT_621643 [Marasmius fiardii PR-910]|nr:hypothetical protein L218DRAFT_621643 [Marasmius fiardii PR-910]